MSQAVFTAKGLTKTYVSDEATVHALNEVDLEIAEREVVVLLGPFGSGKTTLLNIMGGLLLDPTGSEEGERHRRSQGGLTYYRSPGMKVTGIMTNNGSCYRAKAFARALLFDQTQCAMRRDVTPKARVVSRLWIRRRPLQGNCGGEMPHRPAAKT